MFNRASLLRLAVVSILALAVAACEDPIGIIPSPTPLPPTPRIRAKSIDACTFISLPEVGGVVGYDMKELLGNSGPSTSSTDCSFYSPSPNPIERVDIEIKQYYEITDDLSHIKFLFMLPHQYDKYSIAGLGDIATATEVISTESDLYQRLSVLRQGFEVTVTVAGKIDDKQRLNMLEDIAIIVMNRLPLDPSLTPVPTSKPEGTPLPKPMRTPTIIGTPTPKPK